MRPTTWQYLAVFSLLAACAASASLFGVAPDACHVCKDEAQCCDPTFCCSGTKAPYNSSICCDSATQSCCGGTCCEKQTTFCCPAVNQHPDRCCPRWTVCCPGGQDGCCTPEEAERLAVTQAAREPTGADYSGKVMYALYLEVATLKAVKIELPSGKIAANVKVTGFNSWGEMTRLFTYDQSRNRFYYVEANFTGPDPAPGKDPKRKVTFYSVDPTTGDAKSFVVPGVYNFPTAFEYSCKLDAVVVSVKRYATNGEQNGYMFYKIDPETAAPTLMTQTDLAGDNSYAGWFHAISAAGDEVYRLGYRNVEEETEPGLGVTPLSGENATTQWKDVTPAPKHDFYASIAVSPDNTFYSLATELPESKGFDLIRWGLDQTPKVIATFGNAHPVPFFGVVGATMSCAADILVSSTVEDHVSPLTGDRWVFHLTALNTLNDTIVETQPKLPANEISLSGVGIPMMP